MDILTIVKGTRDTVMWISIVAAGTGAVWAAYETNAVSSKQAENSRTSTATIELPSGKNGSCASVPWEGTTLEGKAKLLHSEQLWVLLQASGEGKFYTVGKQIAVTNDTWSKRVPKIGRPGDADAEGIFQLVVVRANLNAANFFATTITTKTGSYATLPAGATIVDQVCLKRE